MTAGSEMIIKGYAADIARECLNQGLLRNEAAYVLATSQWETAHTHEPVVEAYWLSEDWRKNNLHYYPWHGRGFVQLTWEENYARAQQELGLGTMLTDDPDTALDPQIAKQVIVRGMKEGWFTGKKLSDYLTLQHSDFVNARRIVNGTDKAEEIAALAIEYDGELERKGYGVEEEAPAAPPPTEGAPVMPPEFLSSLHALIDRVIALEQEVGKLSGIVDDLVRWKNDD